jgi:RHS repeat-associated protein
VLGTADPAATVRVNDEPVTQRNGPWFYHELALDGTGAPGYFRFPVSATQLQGTPPTSELVRSETRKTFVPASPESYTYDPDGNLTQDGRWVNTYDCENRLIKQETRADVAQTVGLGRQRLSYTYDANGRRIAKKVETYSPLTSTFTLTSETRFLYDGWNLAAELQVSGLSSQVSLQVSYTWGLDLSGSAQGAGGVGGLLWSDTYGPTAGSPATAGYAPAYDGNGNIIAWVDLATGAKVSETDYDAFGNVIQISGTNPTPFGFSTKYLDSETGLNYYGFRYYNPSTGRWLSRDPIGERGGKNLYGMVDNNPVKFWDYLGLEKTFRSEEAAANAALKEAYTLWRNLVKSNPTSRRIIETEFGGIIGIHCSGVKWTYSGPGKGAELGTVRPADFSLPTDIAKYGQQVWTRVATYHTHYVLDYNEKFGRPLGYQPFSTTTDANPTKGDTANTIPGQRNYVIEPNADMWVFSKPAMPSNINGENDEYDKWARENRRIERNPGNYVMYIGRAEDL